MTTPELVQNYLQQLTKRDLENVLACFAETIDWNIPGDATRAPWLGKRSTKAEAKKFFELLWENTIPLDAKIDLLLCEGDNSIVAGEFSTRMTKNGKVINSPFTIQLGFQEGLITKYVLMEDSFQLSEKLKT